MKRIILTTILVIISVSLSLAQYSDALLKKAQSGNIASQVELARCYREGDKVDLNEMEAIKWYEKAANQNNIDAMMALAEIYINDENLEVEPDFVKGLYWLRKAANKGSQNAKEALKQFTFQKEEISHECPYTWIPVDADYDDIPFFRDNLSFITQEHQKGNPVATYYLSLIAFADNDYDTCVRYLLDIYPKVTKGDIDSREYFDDIFKDRETMYPIGYLDLRVGPLLGVCYDKGYGVKKDLITAAKYYLTDSDGFYACGIPQYAKVMGAYCLRDAGKYDEFINLATTLGPNGFWGGGITKHHSFPCLQLELAEMYKDGVGVAKNEAKALSILETIVDSRKDTLGLIAVGWEVRSARDIGRAAYRASLMYRNGIGCEKDSEMAALYYDIAIKYGDNNAWYEMEHK
ncbi:MAG: hypothetical protein K2M56_08585 [Muribaculaceae bacterium]|nr:hypothetical protein [Muribaculaceae bacterium]